MLYGPIGGTGGSGFDDPITASRSRIKRIIGRDKELVDALAFEEVNKTTGATTAHPRWGGDGGIERVLDLTDDWYYLYGIEGEYKNSIDYLKFYVWNAATQKPELSFDLGKAGKPGAVRFRLVFGPQGSNPPKEIYGFAGRSWTYLDAIGIYVRDYYNGVAADTLSDPKLG